MKFEIRLWLSATGHHGEMGFDYFNSHVYLMEYAAVITFVVTSPTCYISF